MASPRPWPLKNPGFALEKTVRKNLRTYKNVLAEIWMVYMFFQSQTRFIREQLFVNWLCFEESAGLRSSSGFGLRCLCLYSRWADLEALVSWWSSSFPLGPSSFLLHRSIIEVIREHSLAPITIIRSEYLTRSCIGQLTPRRGHNKSGLFLLSSLFIPVSGFLLAPGARAKSSQNNSPYTLSKELLKSIQ